MRKQINKLQEDYRIRVYLDKNDNEYKSKKYDKIFGFDNITFKLKNNGKKFVAYLNKKPIMILTTNEFKITYKMELSKRLGYLEDYLKVHFYGKEIKMYNNREDPFIEK